MKRLLVLAGFAIVLVVAPAAYAANTLYVDASTGVDSGSCGSSDAPCLTIAQAIANANNGDVIQVAAGSYGESLGSGEAVAVDKSVTLRGPQSGNAGSAARAAEDPATEAVITGGNFDIEASNVNVDGFSFSYAGNQVCIACDSLQSLSHVTIQESVFSGYQPNNFGPWQADDAIGVNHTTNTDILDNYFTSPNVDLGDFGGAVVQYFDGGCSGTVVGDNIFDSADQSALSDMYFYCDSENSEVTSHITVSGNLDTNMGDTDFALFTHIYGSARVDVTDNRVVMTPASSSGIYFSTDAGVTEINIAGNSLTGSPFRAVKLSGGAGIGGSVFLTGNDFSSNGVGLYVGAGALNGATVTLRGNDLSNELGDTAGDGHWGVYNDPSSGGSVDATNNWWGCNAGPGETGCSTLIGDISFDPWLVLGVSASPSSVFDGQTSTITADLAHNSNGDAVPGSETVQDGTPIGISTDLGAFTPGNLTDESVGTTGGVASVTLRSTTAGTAHVTASTGFESVNTTVTFTAQIADATTSTLSPSSASLVANGTATQVLTVQAKDSDGNNLSVGGDTVTITKASGVGTIGAVTDNGDGTYSATVTAPSSAGTGVFVATIDGDAITGGSTIGFYAQPTITSMSRSSGGVGTTVTLTGTNFTGLTHVRLNGTSAAFTVTSNTQLTFTVPAGATTGTITVSNPGASATSGGSFTVAAQPTITSISPGSGPVGTVVTITGTNLTGTVGVEIGHVLTVPTSVTGTQVTFTIPPGAASGTITILNPAGSATSAATYTVTG